MSESLKHQQENPRLIIAHGLAEFFKDEPHKIALWLMLRNPLFGNISPMELMVIRGIEGEKKVANFILSAKELS